MTGWMRRLRGAIGLGLTWALGGFALGGIIELVHNIWPNPVGAAVDIWPAVLAIPGLLGGVAFSAVLGVLGRSRRFDELSLPGVALWGALGGVLASSVPAALMSMASESPAAVFWPIALEVMGPFAIGGAIAASGTLALARAADDQELLEESRDVAAVGLSEDEERSLLGGGG